MGGVGIQLLQMAISNDVLRVLKGRGLDTRFFRCFEEVLFQFFCWVWCSQHESARLLPVANL